MAVDTRLSATTVHIEDGIATLLLDQPGSPVNVINLELLEGLEHALDEVEHGGISGLVVASAKRGQFVAGADLKQIGLAAEPEEPAHLARRYQRILNRLESLPVTTVAAINGPAMGGGLELALACDYRVATEGAILGLPEVQLGLLPAGGGTQRLPRLIGLSRALALILEGKRLNARRARKAGIVDEVVHPAVLLEAAQQRLRRGKRDELPPRLPLDRLAARSGLVRSVIYRQAGRAVRRKTHGHYPAPPRALDTVRAGIEQGMGAGLAAEVVAFGDLAVSPQAHNLIDLFLATEELKRKQRTAGSHISQIGVVGAGFMGSGIAQAGAAGGLEVRLRDVAPEQVGRGIKTARDLTTNAAKKGRFTRPETVAIISRLSGTTDYSGFRRADLAIEAVFEDMSIKRRVIADLEGVLPEDAVIASNTSSLRIGSLAAEARHSARILGMHFFSPVHKMPLLEIIRAPATSDEAVAKALDVGRRMGKTMIVVQDGPGFYTTRVLSFMLQEAGRIFEGGASIQEIDQATTEFGFPTGAFALIDEVGIDVAAHVSQILGEAFGERFPHSASVNHMVAAGRMGRKSGKGFYDYSGRKKKPDRAVYEFRDATPASLPRELIQRRLSLIFVNEAVRCLGEGVIASPRDGDVGAVMGIGFPPFLGGPFRYADSLGIASIAEELRRMEYAYGSQYSPAPLLEEMMREGRSFYA